MKKFLPRRRLWPAAALLCLLALLPHHTREELDDRKTGGKGKTDDAAE